MIEISLIDRGAGETVFDVDVDVILAQAQFRFLAVGVDGDKSAAGIFAAGDEWRLSRGHQVVRPVKQVRGARSRGSVCQSRRRVAGRRVPVGRGR